MNMKKDEMPIDHKKIVASEKLMAAIGEKFSPEVALFSFAFGLHSSACMAMASAVGGDQGARYMATSLAQVYAAVGIMRDMDDQARWDLLLPQATSATGKINSAIDQWTVGMLRGGASLEDLASTRTSNALYDFANANINIDIELAAIKAI